MILDEIEAAARRMEVRLAAKLKQLEEQAGCDANLLYHVGLAHDVGEYGPPDLKAAVCYYERAAESGSVWALHNLGYLFDRQGDYAKARHWYERGAEQGDRTAMTNLAYLYQEGQGVDRDPDRATQLYEDAAVEDPQGRNNLATHLIEGDDLDTARALRLFEDAAEQGHAQAMFNLAQYMLDGLDIGESQKLGLHWMRRAANGGYDKARAWLVNNDPAFITKWSWTPNKSFGPIVFGEPVDKYAETLELVADPDLDEDFCSQIYDLNIGTIKGRVTSIATWTEVLHLERNLVGLQVSEAVEAIGVHGWQVKEHESNIEWFDVENEDKGIQFTVRHRRVWGVSIDLASDHSLWED